MMVKTGEFVRIGARNFYYEIAGAGETVVLGHAGFVDSGMWDDQWEVFSQQYRVLRFDMCGFGRSDPATAPLSRREDLFALLTQLGVEKAHFIGSSMNGEVMLDFALEHPEMVRSVVTVDGVPSGFQMQGDPPPHMMEMFGALQQGDVERASELQVRIWIDGMYRQPDQVNRDVRGRASAMNLIPVRNNTAFIADMQPVNPLNPPAISRLNAINCPVLAIVGALDHPEIIRAADVMVAEIDNAQKVIINDTGHLPNMEKPAEFNDIVLKFLQAQT